MPLAKHSPQIGATSWPLVHPFDSNPATSLPAIHLRKQELKDKATVKLMQSPLYKGLQKSSSALTVKHALSQLNAVEDLRTLAFGKKPAHNHRHEHSVERRMCNACWAEPIKRTSCEHSYRSNPRDHVDMEVQGATSWSSDDIRIKYRSEREREAAWKASQALQEIEDASPAIPILERHPIYVKYFHSLESDNTYVKSLSRAKNKTKEFVLDVNQVWLSNLDHFNAMFEQHQQPPRSTIHSHPRPTKGLRNRHDISAIQNGFCQIQSVSISRSLKHTKEIVETSDRANAQLPPEKNHPGVTGNHVVQGTTPPSSSPSSIGMKKIVAVEDHDFVSLSILICGSMNLRGKVPGTVALSMHRGLWWCDLEFTRPAAIFLRDPRLSSSNTILVVVMLALDSPVLAPRWFAWISGSICGAIEKEIATLWLYVPSTIVPIQELPHVESPLDTYLPCPVALLNGWDEIQPERPEFTPTEKFRQWWRYKTMSPDFNLDAKAFGIRAGIPNKTGLNGRYSWHSEEVVDAPDLIRPRVEADENKAEY